MNTLSLPRPSGLPNKLPPTASPRMPNEMSPPRPSKLPSKLSPPISPKTQNELSPPSPSWGPKDHFPQGIRSRPVPNPFTDLLNTASPERRKKARPALIKGVIGPLDLQSGAGKACPCCRRFVPEQGSCKNPYSFYDSTQEEMKIECNRCDSVKVEKVIVKGWLHKKGSGQDLLGNRSWKPRWAELALATIDGFDVPVPTLLIYWQPFMPLPSTIIPLDSTIVMAVDVDVDDNNLYWDAYHFNIVPVTKKNESPDQIQKLTRSFTVPMIQRNQWIYVINLALQDYEKRKAKHRTEKAFLEGRRTCRPQLPPSPRRVKNSPGRARGVSNMPSPGNERMVELMDCQPKEA